MTPEEIKALQDAKAAADAEVARLKAEIEKGKTPPPKEKEDDDESLAAKAAKEAALKDKNAQHTKAVESAINFKLGLPELMKSSAALLPKTMQGIIEAASKEKYDSEIERANAIRAAFVEEFFSIKENVDSLTASQKSQLNDFLALTKKAREERADTYYNNLFEPALEATRRVRKAEALNRANSDFGNPSDVEEAYRQRIIKKSRKFYLNEKESA